MDPNLSISSLKISKSNANFKIHSFSKDINDSNFYFEVIKMTDSLFLWIGKKEGKIFNDLSVAMVSPIQDTPLFSQVMGSYIDNTSSKLSNKLAKKLNKQVFVSCNVPTDRTQLLGLQQHLLEEIKLNPDCF